MGSTVKIETNSGSFATKVIIILIAAIIGLLIYFVVSSRIIKERHLKEVAKLERQLVNLTDQVKIVDGLYSKMVDKYITSENDLRDSLKGKDKQLAGLIRKNNETIQSYESYILTLKSATDTVLIRDTVLGMKAFNLTYPKAPEKPFISYDGLINKSVISGEWRFGNLPITGSIVEQKDGTWKYYLSAPDFVNFSGIQVKTLSKLDVSKSRKIYYPVGLGYQFYFNGKKSPYLMGGIQYSRFQLMVHSSIYEAGIGGYYLF